MKHILTICSLLLLALGAYAQTVTIKDRETREPLEGVVLTSETPRVAAETDRAGQAEIAAFKDSGRIVVSRPGYQTVALSYAEIAARSFILLLRAAPFEAHEVVVSATRWRQSPGDVPAQVATITAVEAELQNPQTAADLLGVTGLVFIQKSQQGGGSPMIRGFATNRLLYAVDGVRMNTAIFRAGNIQNVISLDPFAIETAEVLFGPASVIYGSDAIGGVMSFQTLTPEFSLSGGPSVTGGAAGRYSSANGETTGHFHVSAGWKKWALTTSISSFDFGDLRQGRHGPDDYIKPFYVQRVDGVDTVVTQDDPLLQVPSGYSQTNLMQKVRFKPGDKWDLQYAFHYSETSSYGRYDRHNRLRNGLPRYAEWDYGPQKWMMNNLAVTRDGGGALFDQMTLRLAQQSFEESRIDRSINDAERHIRVEEVEATSANLDFTKTLGGRHTLYYGAEYVSDDVASTGTDEDIVAGTSAPGPSRYPQATWQSVAAYVSDQVRLSERFVLQAGLRYNVFMLDAEFDTTFYPFPFTEAHINDGSLTGSIGGVYRPSSSWVFSANFATAFRSPNVDDMGKVFDSEPGSVVVPNPALEAEYAYSFDVGVAKVFGDSVKVDLAGYYTTLDNAMVRRDFTLNGEEFIMYDGVLSRVQAIQNAAVANVFGLQAGIEIQWPSGFSFSSDFNFQDGEEELDDGSVSPSRHAAPWFGMSRLAYDADRLTLELSAIYQGTFEHEDLAEEEKAKDEIYAADAEGNTYAPGWYTLNFKALYRLSDHWRLSAGVENMTDQRYRPYSSGISGAGRNFVLSLGLDF
ncbi:MAG: TonB-dependent receptor [Candidatus Aminicenantes bacterium]|nr:TonB-dependent receptor [Candidatus Aminicenantes bacterium]